MKSFEEIDAIMQTVPEEWRDRWCLAISQGGCGCMGCVQIGNRYIMVEKASGTKFRADPEYIDESKIPEDIYNKYKISRDEWEYWSNRESLDKEWESE